MARRVAFCIVIIALFVVTACASMNSGVTFADSSLYHILPEQTEAYLPHTPIGLTYDNVMVYSQDKSLDELCECISNTGEVLHSSKHFRIIQPSDLPSWYLRYEIINREGNVVDCFTTSVPTWIECVNENVLEIGWGAGTGVQVVRFYSIKDDIFSEFFDTPFFIKDEIIAHIIRLDEGCLVLVVQDIFDIELFYREFFFEEFSPLAHPSSSTYVKYLGDNQIKIAALFDADFNEQYVILELE